MDFTIPGPIRKRIPRGSLLTLREKSNLIGVEIGVQYGVNSRWILGNLDIKLLYLVDPYKPYMSVTNKSAGKETDEVREIAKVYLCDFNDKIEWIYKKSWDAVDLIPDNLDFVRVCK